MHFPYKVRNILALYYIIIKVIRLLRGKLYSFTTFSEFFGKKGKIPDAAASAPRNAKKSSIPVGVLPFGCKAGVAFPFGHSRGIEAGVAFLPGHSQGGARGGEARLEWDPLRQQKSSPFRMSFLLVREAGVEPARPE